VSKADEIKVLRVIFVSIVSAQTVRTFTAKFKNYKGKSGLIFHRQIIINFAFEFKFEFFITF